MKRNASRILSLVLAIALVMSMSLTAFALDGHEMYMSPATGTSYTTMATSSTTSVPLEVCFTAYNEGYYTTGFDSADQAKTVSWTVTYNDDGLVNNTVAVSSGEVNSVITSKGTVTLNAGVTGVAVVHAAYNGLTLDLVIARDTTGVQSNVAATEPEDETEPGDETEPDDISLMSLEGYTDWTSLSSFEENTAYYISSAKDLAALASLVNAGNNGSSCTFYLTDNIDLSEIENWTPIGNSTANYFGGTLDGQNFQISNLNVSAAKKKAGGLF